jgi:hypothetical protein
MTKAKKPRNRRINWSGFEGRFSHEKTVEAKGLDNLRRFIGQHIRISVKGPVTVKDAVEEIATNLCMPIDHLAPELEEPVLPRGRAYFRFLFDEFENIAENYQNLRWWFSAKGLCMEVIAPAVAPLGFDDIVGPLIIDAQIRLGTKRLPKDEYKRIAALLSDFPLRDYLPARYGKDLASWNQRNALRAITSFEEALGRREPRFIHRQVMRRFYRAAERFRKFGRLDNVHS